MKSTTFVVNQASNINRASFKVQRHFETNANHRVFPLILLLLSTCSPLSLLDAYSLCCRSTRSTMANATQAWILKKATFFGPTATQRKVKNFIRWLNMLRQVPMSIISPRQYSCCCFDKHVMVRPLSQALGFSFLFVFLHLMPAGAILI